MKHIAQFFSAVLHPLLMPFFGMIIIFCYSILAIFPLIYKFMAVTGVLFFTCLIPGIFIFILFKTGKIKTIGLNNREDRPLPYMICIFSYLCCGIFLYKIKLPLWVLGFFGGALVSILTAAVITFKWKISAHMTGIGGLLGAVFALSSIQMIFPLWLMIVLIVLAGALGTSRILLNRHTFMQVVAGTANGFICVFGGIYLTI